MEVKRVAEKRHDQADQVEIAAHARRKEFIQHLANDGVQLAVRVHLEPDQVAFILAIEHLPEERRKLAGLQEQGRESLLEGGHAQKDIDDDVVVVVGKKRTA